MNIEKVHKGSLQLEESIALQQKGWRFQAVMKVVILLLMIAGALGLFGNGVFSDVEYRAEDGLKVSYERFARSGAEQVIQLQHIREIRLLGTDPSFSPTYTLGEVYPVPDTVVNAGGGTHFVFAGNVQQVTLRLKTDRPGRNTLSLYVNDHLLSLPQMVYP